MLLQRDIETLEEIMTNLDKNEYQDEKVEEILKDYKVRDDKEFTKLLKKRLEYVVVRKL